MSSVSVCNPNIGEVSAETCPTGVDRERLVSGLSALEISRPQEEGGHADSEQIGEILSRVGLKLKTEWLNQRLTDLEASVINFSLLDLTAKATLCLEKFLVSDMNSCGGGVLPENIHSSTHINDKLAGPFVLQVDEIANTGTPNLRYVFMTDGVRRVVGEEYWPIQDLQVLPPPAAQKILVSNVQVRSGILLITPEIKVLKGREEARELVVEALKNPRTRTEDQQMHIDDDDDDDDCSGPCPVAQVVDDLRSTNMRDLTYFAELSQKWARVKNKQPNLTGIIKCFVIGLKEFGCLGKPGPKPNFMYHAVCCANDGVFDYDVMIHNNVVEDFIGLSADEFQNVVFFSKSTPTDKKRSFKEKRRQCELFLAGFRGMMLVEMNKSWMNPVAIKLSGMSICQGTGSLFPRISSSTTI